MGNTITIELSGEDRTRLDDIIALLKQSLSIKSASLDAMTALPEAEPVKEEPTPAEPEKPKATLADVQALVQKLATPKSGKRDAVKSIVNAYAKRVSDIPTDKLDEVMTKLTELEGA